MDKKEFTELASRLMAAYPAANISKATVTVYFEHLRDIPFEVADRAAAKVVETSKFFPSVAELREECLRIQNPDARASAIDALTILNKAISKYGRNRANEAMEYIKNENEVLYEIVKAIRFNNICDSDIGFFRIEFEKLFREASEDYRKNVQLSETTRKGINAISEKMMKNALMLNSDGFY